MESSNTPHVRRMIPPEEPPGMVQFLLDQLYEVGVETVFGIPGDFILQLCRVIEEDPRFRFLTPSHEPAVGFAACGAARGPAGMGVACVTYGAGALNMVNPIAAAYAEKTPVLVLTGGPGQRERDSGILVHHQVKSFESQIRVFREVTHYQAVLDNPDTAAAQIRHAIDVCRLYSLPVYLEVPRDMVHQPLAVGRARILEVPSDNAAVSEAASEILERLSRARQPVLVAGVEVQRQGLAAEIEQLAEALQLPMVTTFMGRGSVSPEHDLYVGTYLGPASPTGVRELVEDADLILLMGALLSDTNMGLRLTALDARRLVHALSREVKIGHHLYRDVPLRALSKALAKGGQSRPAPGRGRLAATSKVAPRDPSTPAAAQVTVAEMIAEITDHFGESGAMPLITDTGDCLFCSHEIDVPLVVASAYYATMGFGVPAAMGWEVTGGDRPMVLVGDGGFQMTGWELLNAIDWGISPVVVLMNNGSWEMLQSFVPAAYNRRVDGRYAMVAQAWGMRAWRVATSGQLRAALREARATSDPTLIEVVLRPGDISRTLATFTRSVGTTPPPEDADV